MLVKKISEQRVCQTFGWFSRIIKPAKILRAILFLALLHLPVQVLNATLPGSSSVDLAWDGSPCPDVTGYRVHYGTASRKYSNSLLAGKVTTVTVPDLVSGVKYFFAVTAYGTKGLESSLSEEVSYVARLPAIPAKDNLASVPETASLAKLQIAPLLATVGIRHTAIGQTFLTVHGLVGQTYNILAAKTLTDWVVIGTVKMGATGSADFTDTSARSSPQRFYRMQQKP